MLLPLRVLIVEDSDDDTALVLRALRKDGYDPAPLRVETEAAMRQALERQPFDLVIADFSLPRFSAPAALALLQEMALDLPFLIVSGTVGDEAAVAAMRAGAHDYLMKSNLARLSAAVQRELRDATQRRLRREAESAWHASETYLRAVVDNVAEGLITLDERGRIESFNPAAERIFGYTSAEIVERHFGRLLAEDAGALRPSGRTREILGRRKDGATFPMELALSETRLGERSVRVAVFRDITERKRAEAEREELLAREHEARTQAESASRAKDQFLSALSHELRTPLTPILLWLRLMRTKPMDEKARARALEVMEHNTRLQAQLVEDILDLSRIITGKFRLDVRDARLVEIGESVVDLARPSAALKGIRLDFTAEDAPEVVVGDPARLQQIMWNLLANALKFTPEGGRVQLTLKGDEARARITVTDTGEGISSDFLPHVFDRFRQADGSTTRSHGGLGLGLAIVRHLVELHGGTVRAESPGIGKGATFTVDLPIGDPRRRAHEAEEPRPRAHGAAPDGTCALDGLRVLVVDDDADTREALTMVLEECKAAVTAVASAADAIRTMDRSLPDVLVCDIGLPAEDGYALIRKVRAREPGQGGRIPAVALTGYAQVEDRRRALRSGFQAHVSKPLDPEELTAVVSTLARGSGESPPTASALRRVAPRP